MPLNQLKALNINYEVVSTEYIYHEPIWFRIYQRLTINRLWLFEVAWLRRFVWKKIWDNCSYSNSEKGLHIIMIIRKVIYDSAVNPKTP